MAETGSTTPQILQWSMHWSAALCSAALAFLLHGKAPMPVACSNIPPICAECKNSRQCTRCKFLSTSPSPFFVRAGRCRMQSCAPFAMSHWKIMRPPHGHALSALGNAMVVVPFITSTCIHLCFAIEEPVVPICWC